VVKNKDKQILELKNNKEYENRLNEEKNLKKHLNDKDENIKELKNKLNEEENLKKDLKYH